jgi:hypothetical protein
LLKSGQWLANSPAFNKKNFTSDYILNKAAAVGLNIPSFDSTTLGDPINTSSSTTAPSKRRLPNLSKIKQTSLDHQSDTMAGTSRKSSNAQATLNEYLMRPSNSAHSVPDLTSSPLTTHDNQTTKSFSQIPKDSSQEMGPNEQEEETHDPATTARLFSTSNRRSKLRQSLVKQASLNNPPSYYKSLNGDEDEMSLYEKNSTTYTSNKELRKTSSSLINTTNVNEAYYSSPSSSISQFNSSTQFSNQVKGSQSKAERLQDPLLLLKKSSSRLSSVNNLADLNNHSHISDGVYDESALFLNTGVKKLIIDNKEPPKQITNAINVQTPGVHQPVPIRKASLSKQRTIRELVKQPDSLSSDPSDNQQLKNVSNQKKF